MASIKGATDVDICLKQISFHLMSEETEVFKKENRLI
jgi:hypothetical protein